MRNTFAYSLSSKSGRWHSVLAGAAILAAASNTQAAFHLWNIREIYSNNSGTLQFIEMFTASSSQQFVGGQQIQVTSGATTHIFTLPQNLPGDTLNHAMLFGTAGLQAAGAPTPNFIIPDGFLFTGGGTITFFGANGGAYTALPTDGVNSRTWGGGNAVNSPQNFAGQVGFVNVPEPTLPAMLGCIGAALLFMARKRLNLG